MRRLVLKNGADLSCGNNYQNKVAFGITVFFIFVVSMLFAGNSNLILKIETTTSTEKPLADAKKLFFKALVAEGDQSRLQAVFAKAQKGKKITLGVIGGSITRAGVNIAVDKRYINVMLAWWRKRFPQSQFELINAGIGATRSDYGAMRAQKDLLSKSPDLVVLEFACNDLETPEYAESYEGMVRQILNSEKNPALLLLFMTRKDGSSVQAEEIKIGSYYQLPMISYRNAVLSEMQTGRLQWEQICDDEVHPNENGHALAGGLLCETLKKALRKFKPGHTLSIPEVPVPLYSDLFEFTSLFDKENLVPKYNEGWTFDGSGKDNAGWKSSIPGSVIEFEISGRQVYLSFWKINGAMGKGKVTVDNGNSKVMDGWFDQTWGGYRDMELIGDQLSPGKHVVRVELLADKNEKSTGNEFRVLCVGSTGVETK